jgi:hypothetical protein
MDVESRRFFRCHVTRAERKEDADAFLIGYWL